MSDGSGSVYYRYTDASGRMHIVDSLDRVPAADRAHAQKVELSNEAPPRLPRAITAPDWASFGLGALAMLLLVGVFRWLPGTMRFVLKLAIIVCLGALFTGGYLAWIRRATGQADAGPVATPQALIDDAKGAVDKLNERMRAQDQAIKQIESEGTNAH